MNWWQWLYWRIRSYPSWRAQEYLFRKAIRNLTSSSQTFERTVLLDCEHRVRMVITARKLDADTPVDITGDIPAR